MGKTRPSHGTQHMTMVLRLTLAAAALSAALAQSPPSAQPEPMSCTHHTDGASYDLSGLREHTIVAQDRMQTSQNDYVYTVGVCKTVKPPANCLLANGDSRVRHYWAPAWQTKENESPATAGDRSKLTCKYLGSPEAAQHTWTAMEDPSKGVQLTYTGGQHCTSQPNLQRKLAINFKCAARTVERVEALIIDESAHCEYEITVDSEYACPTECGLSQTGSVCAAHGICGWDTDSNKARCYCNNGRTGEFCTDTVEEEDKQSYGPILGLLIFVTIAIVVIIGMLVALWR